MSTLKNTDCISILNLIEKTLSRKRLNHTLSVCAVTERLAARFNLDPREADAAALGHDFAREWSYKRMVDVVSGSNDVVVQEEELEHPLLLHGPAAAIELRQLFPQLSHRVFHAIRWHTVGSPEMGKLGFALFIADYIEEGRTHLTEADKVSIEKLETLEEMMTVILDQQIVYLMREGKNILPSTQLLSDYLHGKKRQVAAQE